MTSVRPWRPVKSAVSPAVPSALPEARETQAVSGFMPACASLPSPSTSAPATPHQARGRTAASAALRSSFWGGQCPAGSTRGRRDSSSSRLESAGLDSPLNPRGPSASAILVVCAEAQALLARVLQPTAAAGPGPLRGARPETRSRSVSGAAPRPQTGRRVACWGSTWEGASPA